MFEIKSDCPQSYFFIKSNESDMYLHSDGGVISACEYFESREAAQKVLDKFYRKHVWENGDVFLSGSNSKMPMIYIKYTCTGRSPQVFSLDRIIGGPALDIESVMDGAKFLFNIREKL